MGNTDSFCCENITEIRRPGALVSVEPPYNKCTDRISWHGQNDHGASSIASTNMPLSPHTLQSTPRQSLRGTTWHGLWPYPPSPEEDICRRRERPNSGKGLNKKLTHAVAHFFQYLEDFMFPKSPLLQDQYLKPSPRVRGGVLLRGCETPEEHCERIKTILEAIKKLHGSEGLEAIGLEYRIVPCDEHKPAVITFNDSCKLSSDDEQIDNIIVEGEAAFAAMAGHRTRIASSLLQPDLMETEMTASLRSNDGSYCSANAPSHCAEIGTTPSLAALDADDYCCDDNTTAPDRDKTFCHLCSLRLFDIKSSTMVDSDNRKEFIADGDMYEAVSRLVQERAQNIMMEEGGMEWVTVGKACQEDAEPIRFLINSDHPWLTRECGNARPTLLICTGRGKVRAGIFSRQHLICSGLETATAVPLVRDAVTRHLNVVIVDPNVHGENQGFVTFQKTMDSLEEYFGVSQDWKMEEKLPCRDLYVVSHSASGGHMVRYFLNKCDSEFLRNIRAIAFTDSTHSIQWAKAESTKCLYDMLQSDQCVYFRCAREGDGIAGDGNKWYLHPAGEQVLTDSFWRHRFGTIPTMWAGTNEHSMTNWYSHAKIWEHFDNFLFGTKFNATSHLTYYC